MYFQIIILKFYVINHKLLFIVMNIFTRGDKKSPINLKAYLKMSTIIQNFQHKNLLYRKKIKIKYIKIILIIKIHHNEYLKI